MKRRESQGGWTGTWRTELREGDEANGGVQKDARGFTIMGLV